MSSSIMPTQQPQMMPVIDLSQQPVDLSQPQEQYYAMPVELLQQPQDQYLPNNQEFIPGNITPVETYHRTRIHMLPGPLLTGTIAGVVSGGFLKLTTYMFEKLGMAEHFKMSNQAIFGFAAGFGLAKAILQNIRIEKAKAKENHNNIVMQRGI